MRHFPSLEHIHDLFASPRSQAARKLQGQQEDNCRSRKLAYLDLVLRILEKTEGRDQFSKLLQYAFLALSSLCKFASYFSAAVKFKALFSSFCLRRWVQSGQKAVKVVQMGYRIQTNYRSHRKKACRSGRP